jgi:hypothetical protein
LRLEWNCVGIWENAMKAVADALSLNQSLEELDLRSNKIGPQAAACLLGALKNNTTLRKLGIVPESL